MKIVIQIGVLLLVLSLLLLAFKLLVKSRLLPLLIWCGLGWKLYPNGPTRTRLSSMECWHFSLWSLYFPGLVPIWNAGGKKNGLKTMYGQKRSAPGRRDAPSAASR